jgi:thiol-disulfide isomerase/thioredoxin
MKNRKALLLGVVLLLIGSMGWLGYRSFASLRVKKETMARRQRLVNIPAFTEGRSAFLTPDGARPVVVVFFNPACEHCQHEAEELPKHPSLLRAARVWLLSTEPLPLLQTFAQRYRLDSLPGVTVARIEPRAAFDSLGFRGVPHLLVYGSNGTLKKEFRGETRWEAVEKAL